MNILLDTNLLYHLIGISVNTKINNSKMQEVIKRNKVFFSEYSVIEFISSNRNEYWKVKKLLEFIFENDYSNNMIDEKQCLSKELLFTLYRPRPVDNLLYYIEAIHKKRIEIETEFIRMYIFTFIALALTSIENTYEVDEVELNILTQIMIFIKDDFSSLVNKKLECIYSSSQGVSMDCSDLFDSIYIETLSMLIKQIEIEDRYLRRLKLIQNSPLSLIIKGNKSQYAMQVKSELSRYFISKNINSYHGSFILRKIEIMLRDEKSRFKKNDIFDMLILNSALMRGMPVITLDTGCIGYLNDIDSKKSLDLIKRVTN